MTGDYGDESYLYTSYLAYLFMLTLVKLETPQN